MVGIETEFHRRLKELYIVSEHFGASREIIDELLRHNRYVVRNCILPFDVGLDDWYSWKRTTKIRVDDCVILLCGIYSYGGEVVVSVNSQTCCKQMFSSSNQCISSLVVPVFLRPYTELIVKVEYPEIGDEDVVEFALVGLVVEPRGRYIDYVGGVGANTNI